MPPSVSEGIPFARKLLAAQSHYVGCADRTSTDSQLQLIQHATRVARRSSARSHHMCPLLTQTFLLTVHSKLGVVVAKRPAITPRG